ncbi:hypothetical protein EDF24_2536 [Curtobacterium sp. PhB130]|uniref:hypothetical protein n=1 Tax=Curtobacterium sp. PhB130 TaxID=2485178 RepID=UPI000F4C143F|nr:hypothetical protein [Curtobacterium sp. PhB130]ROS75095.1 hypothetical protein EDF24_2536 [Curtobacterium sp. PhB130]
MTGRTRGRVGARLLCSLAVLTCVVATVSGCDRARPDADTPREAVQGTWVLDHDVDAPEVPFVTFAKDRSWSASDGCDRVYGTWRITAANRLTVVTGPHAELSCAGAEMVDAVLAADTARVPRATERLQLRGGGSTLALDPSTDPDVGGQGRPIGYWVHDHSAGSPYLSLRADDSYRLSDGCGTSTGTWKFSTTEQVRLYPTDTASSTTCQDGDDSGVGASTRGRVSGSTMTLSTTDGATTGTLHRFER